VREKDAGHEWHLKGSFGYGLEAGLKKCTLGPLKINGPSLGVAMK
jgi:hypothetical protein